MAGLAHLAVGDPIPEWDMPSVSAARMRTMAAILRDPNPLHWDRQAVAALPLNLGERTINQGPLGLSYILNMLHAWAGPTAVKRLVMRFPQVVLDGEQDKAIRATIVMQALVVSLIFVLILNVIDEIPINLKGSMFREPMQAMHQ